MAQRVFLSIAASEPKKKVYLRDIIQAYIQSLENIGRKIYFEPVPEMGLPKSVVLKAVKPLYGIPESGLLWFKSYSGHHVSTLGMTQSKVDECCFFKRGEDGLSGMTILQVDDSVGLGDDEFLDLEEKNSNKFRAKPRSILSSGESLSFNGGTIGCLLYTSPSPRDQRGSRMPSSA